jgi:hypothetical protein
LHILAKSSFTQTSRRATTTPPHHHHTLTKPHPHHANSNSNEKMTASQTKPTVYIASNKRQITDSAERGGAKAGTLKKNAKITAIASARNSEGDLRVQCARGWVTAELANGQKCMAVDTGAAPKQQVRKAFGERTSSAQNSATPPEPSTPTKKAAPALPSAMQIAALISAIRAANPDLNVKKLAVECKAKRPDWKVGCKEVRAQIEATTTFMISSRPGVLLSPAPKAYGSRFADSRPIEACSSPWRTIA